MADPPVPPAWTGVSHVALTVRDLERSVRWYGEVLGLQPLMTHADPDHEFVLLRHPSSGTLLGLHRHDANDGGAAHEARTGLDHLAFGVADRSALEAWSDHLAAASVPTSPVVDAPYGHVLSFRDPDGIPLELFALRA